MTEKRECRRLQFGLRKVLLWTAVVSLYCGVCKAATGNLTEFWYWTAMVAIAGIVRAVADVKTGYSLSMLCGVPWAIFWDTYIVPSGRWSPGFSALDLLVVMFGLGAGALIFSLVLLVSLLVDWVDDLMRTNTDRD